MKRDIVFTEKMYNTADVDKNASFYKWRLLHKVGRCDVYFIVLSVNNELEIIHGDNIEFELSGEHPLVIAGMSKTKEGALAVVASMVSIMTDKKCGFDYRLLTGQVAV